MDPKLSKELKFTKLDWEKARQENVNLIIGNKIQIEMALVVIDMIDNKISDFPKEDPVPKKKIPTGVN